MFLKARQWLRMMLLSLVVQIGNLAKVGIRKGYDDKYENQRQLQQVENDFNPGIKSDLNGPSRSPSDDLSKYQLSLTGKLEPVSNLPTVNLHGNPRPGHASRIGDGGPFESLWEGGPVPDFCGNSIFF